MTTSWLHALLGIIHNAKHHKKVCEKKETAGLYRMKLPGTCSLSKEIMKKKKKKKNGTPILGEWDSYFLAGTPTFYTRIPRRRHRTCWGKSHRSHNQNVIIKSVYFILSSA